MLGWPGFSLRGIFVALGLLSLVAVAACGGGITVPPKPAVTPRRCRVHSFGSDRREPNTRSGQRSTSVLGWGTNFLIHWRGMGPGL